MAHAAYVFDAYGTLFDVHAAVRKYSESVGPDAARLSQIWREKQLEYSWVRALMGHYRDFWELTQEALDTAFALTPSADAALKSDLLNAYWTLDCYQEVPQVLTELKNTGAKLAILSNGSPAMLDAAVNAAGLTDLFDEVFSVDDLRTFKTDPKVYELVTTQFRIYPDTVSFQSSNRWDIAGATAFGFRTVWMNRTGMPDEYADLAPAAVLKDLTGLPPLG
ncbi:2-haloacid dehalogenase [Roseibium hamelinense]|uniref:(S)-2-haloacid dehalogenase n=1 Tax=Roseibium hamelinense TaxID=150831 RepID=A0A562TJP1_9HYPH|nr:haloacid dehalogenase type II [Roseibium hamelinense]MTI42690.1 haloacid dehalogenase type II [Roseibium hamelinense]TWI93316.1 2-haloacid dehalogenase [Roseibium hamelinense]